MSVPVVSFSIGGLAPGEVPHLTAFFANETAVTRPLGHAPNAWTDIELGALIGVPVVVLAAPKEPK